MPVLKSAIKKLRVDRKREEVNKPVKSRMKRAIKKTRMEPSAENLREAYSAIDKAKKRNIINQGKAARIKSRLVAHLRSSLKKSPFAK